MPSALLNSTLEPSSPTSAGVDGLLGASERVLSYVVPRVEPTPWDRLAQRRWGALDPPSSEGINRLGGSRRLPDPPSPATDTYFIDAFSEGSMDALARSAKAEIGEERYEGLVHAAGSFFASNAFPQGTRAYSREEIRLLVQDDEKALDDRLP